MTPRAASLLAELLARGVTICADGGDLRLRPASACEDLLPDLRERKPELLALLSVPLADRVLEILPARGGRHTTLSLALALGRPRDLELYAAFSTLMKHRAITAGPNRGGFPERERGRGRWRALKKEPRKSAGRLQDGRS